MSRQFHWWRILEMIGGLRSPRAHGRGAVALGNMIADEWYELVNSRYETPGLLFRKIRLGYYESFIEYGADHCA